MNEPGPGTTTPGHNNPTVMKTSFSVSAETVETARRMTADAAQCEPLLQRTWDTIRQRMGISRDEALTVLASIMMAGAVAASLERDAVS